MWLRVARNGERVSAWGEAPDEGVGIAPHYESEVDVVAPLADTLAGDCLQVTKLCLNSTCKTVWCGFEGVGSVLPSHTRRHAPSLLPIFF